jgi:DNA-binding transcriptional ArsR family regulator
MRIDMRTRHHWQRATLSQVRVKRADAGHALTAIVQGFIFNRMVEQLPRLDGVFAALADPTRRTILKQLGKNPSRVTDIAKNFTVSLNAVSKHLMVLERAGLIRRNVRGREHLIHLNGEPLAEAAQWLGESRAFWAGRLDSLEAHIVKKRGRKR